MWTWRCPARWPGGRGRPAREGAGGSRARRRAAGVGEPRGPGQPCWLGPPAAASPEAAGTQSSLCAAGGLALAGAPERRPGEGRSAAPCSLCPWASSLQRLGLSPGPGGGLREENTTEVRGPVQTRLTPPRQVSRGSCWERGSRSPPHREHLFCLPGLCWGGLRAYPLHSATPSGQLGSRPSNKTLIRRGQAAPLGDRTAKRKGEAVPGVLWALAGAWKRRERLSTRESRAGLLFFLFPFSHGPTPLLT